MEKLCGIKFVNEKFACDEVAGLLVHGHTIMIMKTSNLIKNDSASCKRHKRDIKQGMKQIF